MYLRALRNLWDSRFSSIITLQNSFHRGWELSDYQACCQETNRLRSRRGSQRSPEMGASYELYRSSQRMLGLASLSGAHPVVQQKTTTPLCAWNVASAVITTKAQVRMKCTLLKIITVKEKKKHIFWFARCMYRVAMAMVHRRVVLSGLTDLES